MRKRFDSYASLGADRGPKAARRSSLRPAFCLRLIALTVAAVLININQSTSSNAYGLKRYQTDWALVAMNHLQGDLEQTQCWVELIWRESRFNPLARNGSHYGLAQMRNIKVKDLTPREQVRWHMRYLDHRYDGLPCKALNHLKTKGWH